MTRRTIYHPERVKRSLRAHSLLGLALAIPLYLICLSGTLVVFYHELQRWEQPNQPETMIYSAQQLQSAYNNMVADDLARAARENTAPTHHMFVTLPTHDLPRARIASDFQSRYIAPDGTLTGSVSHPWTDFLTNLHIYLHLPYSYGMIVMGAIGALVTGLMLSGVLALPRIFKDAFRWRRRRGERPGEPRGDRLQQADSHNRLSLWVAPFMLMLAITGAAVGLAPPLNSLLADTLYDGNDTPLKAAIYGAKPELQRDDLPVANIATAMEQLHRIAPDSEPFYITVENMGEPEQYIMVGAKHPQRLIFAEQYRFNSDGHYLSKVGFSDGDAGQQITFSLFNLHFGHYGDGFWGELTTKSLYVLFGLAFCWIVVSGVNIWIQRSGVSLATSRAWYGLVWGTPLMIAVLALLSTLGWNASLIPWFWSGLLLMVAATVAVARLTGWLRPALALVLILLAGVHWAGQPVINPLSVASLINCVLVMIAAALMLAEWQQRRSGSRELQGPQKT